MPGHGYVENGLAGASLSSPYLTVVQEFIPDVRKLDNAAALGIKTRLLEKLGEPCPADETLFAMLLIDGLCEWEEFVAASLYGALGGIPLIGGSAGTDGSQKETRVLSSPSPPTR